MPGVSAMKLCLCPKRGEYHAQQTQVAEKLMEHPEHPSPERLPEHENAAFQALRQALEEQRALCLKAAPPSPGERREALARLGAEIKKRRQDILEALWLDLGKAPAEAYMSELGLVFSELRLFCGKLKKWARPRRCKFSPSLWPARSFVAPEPFGQALILSPWNYPFQLAMLPFIAALAAGNRVVLAPSGDSPATSALLGEIVAAALPPRLAYVAIGGVPVAETLLAEPFDFIFYTGSTRVGRLVMEAAAKRLTPVCLELGGKSPVVVAQDADLDLAARRIAWGKILNAGQTCVAPDYLLAQRGIASALKEKIELEFRCMLGENPLASPDYGRIVSRRSFDRLLELAASSIRPAGPERAAARLCFGSPGPLGSADLADLPDPVGSAEAASQTGSKVPEYIAKAASRQSSGVSGGPTGTPPSEISPAAHLEPAGQSGRDAPAGSVASDSAALKIAPSVFYSEPDSPIMREEIFGPLLPLLVYDDIDEALAFIKQRPKPLAAYIFTDSEEPAARFAREIAAGGCCVNDVVMQAASPHLPFGGIGPSGMGRYHGRAGFELFSNLKGVLRPPALPFLRRLDLPLRYPPYGLGRLRLLRLFMR